MRISNNWILVGLLFLESLAYAGPGQEQVRQNAPTLSVCEAATFSPGTRVRVGGKFDGFGYDTDSMRVTIKSGEICNKQGAGLVFAALLNKAERKKLYSTLPGTPVVIEGTVDRVEQGRFIHLSRTIVTSR